MKIDFKGFFIGSLIGILLLLIVGAILGFLFVIYLQNNGGLYEVAFSSQKLPLVTFILFLSMASSLACFVCGWFTARFSVNHRLYTAVAVGILLASFAFYPAEDKDFLLTLIGAVIPIPFTYYGANRYLKRANKVPK